MKFSFFDDGTMTLEANGVMVLGRSPVGMITVGGVMCAPISADIGDETITLHYGEEDVTLTSSYRENGSLRLEVAEISDYVDGFTFGPYACPKAVGFGEMVGAAWSEDGSAVCIQGLNTKTVGEIPFGFRNESGFPSPCTRAAGLSDGVTVLSCSAENMTRPKTFSGIDCGFTELTADIVEGADGEIAGAAIALLFADNTDMLLEDIGKLELEEGLPHPLIDGVWAKISPRASDIYLIFDDGDQSQQLAMAELAGVRNIYFSDPFESWGHFDINKNKYPGGRDEFCRLCTDAADKGIQTGFHTLSNFIHTTDPYITPIPHPDLLSYDKTELVADISEQDDSIPIFCEANYKKPSALNAVRIGDEIIRYTNFDEATGCLTGCERGAFGTISAIHKKGDTLVRLADHGYRTLFPNIRLQKEMAEAIGKLIRDAHIGRISFDGMEGCFYTGRGEYAASEFVKNVFDIAGNGLICDASNCSHYRWHAHSYFNHGEPWYDTDRRGGMYNQRVRSQKYFRSNLLPAMLGWYVLWNSNGCFEPTLPETLEAILARTVAFDAGLCFVVQISKNQQKTPKLLATIKLWQEFRRSGIKLPEKLLMEMSRKDSDWHLDKDGDKWILYELELDRYDLSRVENLVVTESGTTGYAGAENSTLTDRSSLHRSCIVFDSSPADQPIAEPFYFRIRLGTPSDGGCLRGLSVYGGWFSSEKLLGFDGIVAHSGDYLEYHGGTELLHFDKDYNLLETVQGVGKELVYNGSRLCSHTLHYTLEGAPMKLMLTHFFTAQKYIFLSDAAELN